MDILVFIVGVVVGFVALGERRAPPTTRRCRRPSHAKTDLLTREVDIWLGAILFGT